MKKFLKLSIAFISIVSIGFYFIYSKDERECVSENGLWKDVSGSSHILGKVAYDCYLPTDDAGQSCTDSSQCDGECLANIQNEEGAKSIGTCSEYSSAEGKAPLTCQKNVENSITESQPCY